MSSLGGIGGGAPGAPFANLYVQFSQQGLGPLTSAVEDLGKKLEALTNAVKDFGVVFTGKIDLILSGVVNLDKALVDLKKITADLTKAFQLLVDVINTGLKAAIGVLSGLVSAGIAASVMGQQLQFIMKQLALTIAGLFAPEIQFLIDLLERLTTWLNNLTDAQRDSLARWLEAAAAALAVSVIFPRVVTGIIAVVAAVRALTAAIVTGLSATGIGALLPLLGLLLEALAALLVGTEGGRKAIGALWEAFKPIISVVGEFLSILGESLAEVFSALAEAIAGVITLLKPLLDLFALLAKVVLNVLLAPLVLLAKTVKFIADTLKSVLGISTEEKKAGARGRLAESLGGPTDLGALYLAVAEKSRLGAFGKGVDQLQLETQQAMLAELQKANGTLDSANPIINKGA